jgi:hypothetical protein
LEDLELEIDKQLEEQNRRFAIWQQAAQRDLQAEQEKCYQELEQKIIDLFARFQS